MKRTLLPMLLALVLAACAGQTPEAQQALETPTMGWSSWNTFQININDSLIMDQADAMVKSGLADAGFRYINIDDGYFGGRDKTTGQLLIHPTRFPKGMKTVVDHIHSLGLKAGIYSDAGYNTCGNYYNKDTIAVQVGLYGHDQQDADFFFKELGFDFIKVDFCGGTAWQNHQRLALDPQTRYTAIRKAIDATGRTDVRLNVCRWNYPGTWVRDVALSWRISGDISARWQSVRSIINESLYLSAYAGGGHYNDMDMLEVGRNLSLEEDRTHFGMWCIMASPLLIGCDLTKLRPETLELLTNREIIALNQDPLGLQAYVVRHDGETYVLAKDILEREGLVRAAALYNPSNAPQTVKVAMDELCLGGKVSVRDLIARADLQPVAAGDTLALEVPAHGCRLVRLTAEKRIERTLYEAETAFLSAYQELYNENVVGTGHYAADEEASGRMMAVLLGNTPVNDLRWQQVYSQKGGDYTLTFRCRGGGSFYVMVNDGNGRQLNVRSFDNGWSEVSLPVHLEAGDNEVRLFNDRGRMPDMDCMTVARQ